MSELIVIGYEDRFRAPEVLNELRRRDWDWVADLDHALVVTRDLQGEMKIQFSLSPSSTRWEAWARIWGAFLSLAFMVPVPRAQSRDFGIAAGEMADLTGAESSLGLPPDIRWWTNTVEISDIFVRDVGALIGPDDSALILLLQTPAPGVALRRLRDYGGTLLHLVLSPEQDAELQAALSPG